MDIVVQVATILSPIIAVLIAWWMVKSSAKDTAKQLVALEANTSKQIDSIKELSKHQIEASIKQVELEIEKTLFLANQAKQEWEGVEDINNSGLAHMMDFKKASIQEFQEKKPLRDYKLYCQIIKNLESIKQNLQKNLKNLE